MKEDVHTAIFIYVVEGTEDAFGAAKEGQVILLGLFDVDSTVLFIRSLKSGKSIEHLTVCVGLIAGDLCLWSLIQENDCAVGLEICGLQRHQEVWKAISIDISDTDTPRQLIFHGIGEDTSIDSGIETLHIHVLGGL